MSRLTLVTALTLSAQLAVAADAVRGGELYSARCGACHSIADNGAGPRHAGLFGRKAGTQPGFDYSPALERAGIVWDASQLDRWIADPNALVPGNKMVVQLAADPHDRNDIIAYLRQATQTVAAATPFHPTDPDFVVAELPAGSSRTRTGSARQIELSRSDPRLAAQLAAALLEQARTSAQPQLYGRAESVLAPWMAQPTVPAPLLVLQADILQQRHEFDAAIALLDRALAQDPRSAQARLMRANAYIVTGDYEHARPDCAWLLGSGEQWSGSVCIAQVLGSTGQLERARALLERLIPGDAASPSGQGLPAPSPSAEILAWALSVRADLAVRAGALPEAQDMLTRAVALAPASDYTRIALADVLIARNRLADAVDVLDMARPSVGVLLRRAVVESRTHAGRTPDSLAQLKERLNVSAQRGERTHLREETRLALEFPHDAAGHDTADHAGADGRPSALTLARENFNVQRETEDIRLLARAAAAARDTAALAALKAWLQRSHYEDTVVDQLLRSGQPS